jgi:Asp-tRNA(Asn)/Glu-tRNA(Gln) amidotransferase A subunit family amidase
MPEGVEGAPCGLQVMGRHMRDEELVRDVQVISDVLEN